MDSENIRFCPSIMLCDVNVALVLIAPRPVHMCLLVVERAVLQLLLPGCRASAALAVPLTEKVW